jgi:hypothetical protein
MQMTLRQLRLFTDAAGARLKAIYEGTKKR